MGEIIGILIVISIVYFLYKKGWIEHLKFPIVKVNYMHKHFNNKLALSYGKFNGIEKYPFFMKNQVEVTLKYNVSVENGSLILIWRDKKNVLFKKEFTTDEQGDFTFTTERDTYYLSVIGSYTKGGCNIDVVKD